MPPDAPPSHQLVKENLVVAKVVLAPEGRMAMEKLRIGLGVGVG